MAKLRGLLASALALAAAAASGAPADELQARVDAVIRPLMAEHDIPGMAVAISLDGQPQHFSYGVASRESGQAVTPHTLFEIGSLSKTFTATLAAYAQARGRLELSDPAGRHLPALRDSPLGHISLLQLGTYTGSDLPLQFPAEVDDEARMLAYYHSWQPPEGSGERRRYSNPSIGLLGLLGARSLGRPFPELLENELFPKLGLTHSYIRVPAAQMGLYAQGYDRDDRPVRVNPGMLDAEAYGVKSDASDMLRFVAANLDAGALEPALREAIETTQRGYYQVGEMTQGLGWERYPYPITTERLLAGNSSAMALEAQPARRIEPALAPTAQMLLNKTGSTNGFGAYALFIPARQVGIVLLANRNYPNAARVQAALQLLDAL
ncbi:class C beta-lactamase [Pseudomonas sp. CAU 1711]|uniref:class C beta-lactamase n=1 Tax=Pseudomonas sp. CAU 1711 TaxID=3140356 RepID=UPI003261CEF2